MHLLPILAQIPTTFDVPGIGPVTMPEWVVTEEAAAFFMGFAVGAGVCLVRAALRWFKRADGTNHGE